MPKKSLQRVCLGIWTCPNIFCKLFCDKPVPNLFEVLPLFYCLMLSLYREIFYLMVIPCSCHIHPLVLFLSHRLLGLPCLMLKLARGLFWPGKSSEDYRVQPLSPFQHRVIKSCMTPAKIASVLDGKKNKKLNLCKNHIYGMHP